MIRISAERSKNGRDDEIPLHPDVRSALETLRPPKFQATARVFSGVPSIRAFDGDLKAAGIPKRDASGRVVDLHAMRMTTGTMLARANVPPHVAKQIMRHRDVSTTLLHYTDYARNDGLDGVRTLPSLPITTDHAG